MSSVSVTTAYCTTVPGPGSTSLHTKGHCCCYCYYHVLCIYTHKISITNSISRQDYFPQQPSKSPTFPGFRSKMVYPVNSVMCEMNQAAGTFLRTSDMMPMRVSTCCRDKPSRGTPSANVSALSAPGSQRCRMNSDTYALNSRSDLPRRSRTRRSMYPLDTQQHCCF